MKQLRFSTLFFLILAVGLIICASPASAALYQDTFTAEVYKATNYNGGWNPYGLPTTSSWTFTWSIVYDESTINAAGTVRFSGFYPSNQISIIFPRPGTPQIFTQMDDDLYGPGWLDNPYGWFDKASGNFLELAYVFNQKPLPSPYNGYLSITFFDNEIWFEDGISKATRFYFDPGYETFDRQVVPIPGALVLLGSGLAALTILKRRRG
jgi:hypothetical protein